MAHATHSDSLGPITPSMILRLSGVEEVMSYTLSLPSHDAVT